MSEGHRVLVVDGLAETEQVLKAVLEPRGLQVNRVRRHSGLQQSVQPPPHLVVLDASDMPLPIEDRETWATVPRIIIGSIELDDPATPKDDDQHHHLTKPFHYGELIRAIEQMLAH